MWIHTALLLTPLVLVCLLLVALPIHATYTPTTTENTCASGAVATITVNGLECKLLADILAQGVTVNSGTLTACSDDELFWTDNGKIKCVALYPKHSERWHGGETGNLDFTC